MLRVARLQQPLHGTINDYTLMLYFWVAFVMGAVGPLQTNFEGFDGFEYSDPW